MEAEVTMDHDATRNDGARELIARLAAAVMIADGHITESELCSLDHLRALELGSFSTFVEAEIQLALCAPIDVTGTAAALAKIAPEAGTVIVSALAQIAASDRQLSQRELDVLRVVARVLGLSGLDADNALRSTAGTYGTALENPPPLAAVMRPQFPAPAGASAQAGVVDTSRALDPLAGATPAPSDTAGELEWALPILGLGAGASPRETDVAYAVLLRRYNPAGAIELGPEFAVLAVQRLNAVTAAYLAARQELAKSTNPSSPRRRGSIRRTKTIETTGFPPTRE